MIWRVLWFGFLWATVMPARFASWLFLGQRTHRRFWRAPGSRAAELSCDANWHDWRVDDDPGSFRMLKCHHCGAKTMAPNWAG